jgi:hypothetical protein
MTDIVERLSEMAHGRCEGSAWGAGTCAVAVDEIEWLRAELQDWKAAYYADTKRIEAERDRLREEVRSITKVPRSDAAYGIIQCIARAALKETGHE